MMLCQNRPEGFGPHSALHPSVPTSCFIDTILEPLPTWVLLVAVLATLPLSLRSRRQQAIAPSSSRAKTSLESSDLPSPNLSSGAKPSLLSRALSGIYYVLLVAFFAMIALEIARLVSADLGIGLLPFTFVGILTAGAVRRFWRARAARLLNVTYWLFLGIILIVKVIAESKEDHGSAERVKGQGIVGNYPTSDELTDVATMVGLTFILALLELYPLQRLPWL